MVKNLFIRAVVSFFGAGFSPKAPGTAGSAAALVPLVLLALVDVSALERFLSPAVFIPVVVFVYVVGAAATARYMRMTGNTDPKEVVIDEVLGQWLTVFLALPYMRFIQEGQAPSFLVVLFVLSFGLFRFFDVIKPWPASFFDRDCHNAHGVIWDDLAAALYAGLAVSVVLFYLF
jgi:phosphatidylglycerophosphatase A